MRAAVLTVSVLAAIVLLAGCGAGHDHRSTSTATTPNVLTLAPSKMERAWLKNLRLTRSTPAATGVRADEIAASIRKAASVPGVRIASVSVYSTPALASALVLQVARPAYFLRHQLESILPKLTGNGKDPSYLLIVDVRAKRVLEWYGTPHGGSLYMRRGLESCSPIAAHGWSNLEPCPSK